MSISAGSAVAASLRDQEGLQPSRAAGRVSEYRVLLALAIAVYLAVYGSMLAVTGGLPYVLDNNESFSTLWHAYNLFHFDIRQSMGLTDETFSPHAPAHPFVHSHQGNFPRLFAFLIFVLGARTIEAQIVVTTFTVGLVAHFFQFRLFSLISGPRFAFVAALVFATDYLFYAQWQVVTYRVWHGFFLFGSLLCAYGFMRTRHPRRWLLATGLTYLGLFYYELVFVAFVSLFTAFYAVVLGWRMPRRVLLFGGVQGVAGLTSLAILFLQLALYLGWAGLREDLYLTYVARNFATETADLSRLSPWSVHDVMAMIGGITSIDPSLREQLERFYERYDLIFWWNLADSRPLRQPGFFAATLFVWVFQLYTPLFTLLTGVVLVGWVLAGDRWRRARPARVAVSRWRVRGRFSTSWLELRGSLAVRRERRAAHGLNGRADTASPPDLAAQATPSRSASARAGSVIALGLLGVSACVLAATLLRDDAYRGLPLSRASFLAQIGLLPMLALVGGVLGVTALVARWVAGSWAALQTLPSRRLIVAAVVLVGLTLFVRTQAGLYDQEYAPIWNGMISGAVPGWLGRTAVLAAAALAVALIAGGRRALLGDEQATALERIGPYLICGGLAYALVYYLAAGYVLTGYLMRFGPLVVFVVGALIALAVTVAATVLGRAVMLVLRWRGRPGRANAPGAAPGARAWLAARRGSVLAGGCAGALLLFLAAYWVHTQLAYLAAFPPDRFTFLRMFARTPYRGASFAVSTYSAPLAYFTHQWAYFDPLISNGQVHLAQGQIRLVQDARTYLWYADRRANQRYLYPEYYACITSPSLRGLLQQQIGQEPRTGRCSNVAIVQRAQSSQQEYLRFTLVERDESPADAWAVVRLNWEMLPYLRPIPTPDSPKRLAASLERAGGQPVVAVEYEYVDPYAHPERGSVLRLYDVTAGEATRRLLSEAAGVRRLEVPDGFRGTLQVSVTPSDGTRAGPEYLSEPLEVSSSRP